MNDDSTAASPSRPNVLSRAYKRYCELHQHYLDRSTPYVTGRWTFWVVFSLTYSIRVYLLQGWYIVTYALGIYVLSLLLAFLTPKIDPAMQTYGWYIVTYALGIFLLNLLLAFLTPKIDPAMGEPDDEGPALPTRSSDEFRPFMRRLPEFKFWYSATKAVVIAMFCTFFDALNIPVFWPILVMYFIILFTITMKRQIKHMIKYRYIPFSYGKTKYQGKEDSGKVVSS